jgi:DNA-binding XRE family transcriptional regulator
VGSCHHLRSGHPLTTRLRRSFDEGVGWPFVIRRLRLNRARRVLQSAPMSRPPASEPVCLRCEITTELHAVEVKNTSWWFRARLCEDCYRELMHRRTRWLAQPHVEPDSLRAWRLEHGVTVRELAQRTGLSPSMISAVERGIIKSWPGYDQRLRAAVADKPAVSGAP